MPGRLLRPSPSRAFTLVEMAVAFVLAVIVLGILYGAVSFFLGGSRPTGVAAVMSRTFAQQQIRIGLQKMIMRIREGTEVLDPGPGMTSGTLKFRDVLNHTVRLRLDRANQRVVSERLEAGAFSVETSAFEVAVASGQPVAVTRPIRIDGCTNLAFTVLSPSCVVVSLTLAEERAENALMTAIELRNSSLALRGEEKP